MKRLLTFLLILLMAVGCTNKSQLNQTDVDLKKIGTSYFEKLKNFKPREISNNSQDNEEFNDYLNDVFLYFVFDNYPGLHQFLKDYKVYGQGKPEVNLGRINYEPDIKRINNEIELADKLESFDYDSLSSNQQLTFQRLEYSFYEDLCGIGYSKYSKIFAKNGGVVSNIVEQFNEFDYFNEEDVKDYFTLLEDVPRYLKDAISYTDQQYKDKIYHSDYSIDRTIEYIKSFTSKKEDNALIISFNNSIDKLNIFDEETKKEYKEKNKDLIINTVIPSFNELGIKLEDYKVHANIKKLTLNNISKEYSELSFMLRSSDNRQLDEIYEELIDIYNDIVGVIVSHQNDQEFLKRYEELYNDKLFEMGYRNIIDYLIDNLPNDDLVKNSLNYSVDNIDKSIENGNTVAYYMIPRIDEKDNNIIKVSPSFYSPDMSIYLTLAHEGVPGHMYQTNYYGAIDHSKVEDVIGFIGYIEGWAMYAEYISLDYLDIDEEMKEYIFALDFSDYVFNCIMDFSINYYGFDNKQIKELIDLDDEIIDAYFNLLIDMPCVYVSYGLGGINMYELYLENKSKLGDDFNLEEFNIQLIKNGDMPFVLLRSCVNDYLN